MQSGHHLQNALDFCSVDRLVEVMEIFTGSNHPVRSVCDLRDQLTLGLQALKPQIAKKTSMLDV